MNSLRVIIVEDKEEDLKHLENVMQECHLADFQVTKVLGSLKDAIAYLKSIPQVDLIFMDIQLPDGNSFEIFNQVEFDLPIIFTSSYDHYVLQAIKLNGLDYLVKPIERSDFDDAIRNFQKLQSKSKTYELEEIKAIVKSFSPKTYKSSFLVNYKQKMLLLDVSEVAYCYVREKGTFLVSHEGQEYLVDYYLDQLEEELDPARFYRVNRQYLMARKAIKEIENYFNGRLVVKVDPPTDDQIIMSKKKVAHFKKWADS
ncbi:LytR/AlgR family response regulator transcription factor [Fulvivirga sediminis]|uniref:Response regulator transcription factor n=1 Tax=Fulvivirga sediminis TaxID=2803949 RepID=A0A937F7P9_9BACT|nr:LytTR family DNA-binding domain-containing protein [Fulvivirga sediminis]MBL3657260.1 response regulator transcription factor [Fulvivirga sediminis]